MTRLAGLTVLALVALPADASNPTRTQKSRPRPVQSAEPPLAVPIPAQPAVTVPVISTRLWEIILRPERALAKFVVTRLIGFPSDPNVRVNQLLNESEDLQQARAELHQFWMNDQPSVLTYQRLNRR